MENQDINNIEECSCGKYTPTITLRDIKDNIKPFNLNNRSILNITSIDNKNIKSMTIMPRSSYVRLAIVKAARVGTSNTFNMEVNFSCSSSSVYSGFGGGQRIYFTGGHPTFESKISRGIWQDTNYIIDTYNYPGGSIIRQHVAFNVTISSTTNFTVRTGCCWCEDGLSNSYDPEYPDSYHPPNDKRSLFEDSATVSLSYINPAITPDKPYPTLTWGSPTSHPGPNNGPTVYRGTKSDNPTDYNMIDYKCAIPANTVHVNLVVRKYINGEWKDVSSGAVSNSTQSYRHIFSEADRGYHFYLYAESVSSTGHTTGSDLTEWRINDLPNMNGVAVTTNVSRTINNVTVNWNKHFSDTFNDISGNTGRWYRVHINKIIDGIPMHQGSFESNNTLSANFNLSDYSIREGDLASIGIEPGDKLEWSFVQYGSPQVRRNSAPYWKEGTTLNTQVDNAPYNKVFNNIIQVNFAAAVDNEGDILEYKYSYRKKTSTGSWSDFIHIEIDSAVSKNIDASSLVPRGDYIQIGVIANDLLQDSPRLLSEVLRRADYPPTVGPITVNPVQSEEHYERISSISWSHITTSTGNNASKYKTEMIVCKTKNVNDVYSISRLETSGISVSYDITTVPRGYYIYFKVTAVDIFGLESLVPSESKWCRRNQAPIVPSTFKVSGDKINFYNTVPLTWSAGSDPDSDAITYTILFSKNRGPWTQIASGLTTLTHTHNISGFAADTTLGYKIKSVDKYNIESSERNIERSHELVVNTKPNPPILKFPILDVYDKNPRIMFNVPLDHNMDSLNILVTMNGETLNSATAPNNFNKSSYSVESGLFMTKDLNIGNNVLTFKTFDGYEYSTEINMTVIYKEPILMPINDSTDVIISKDIYDKFIVMINDTRRAYGKSVYSFESITDSAPFVTAAKFLELQNKIYEVNEFINNSCSGLSRPKTKSSIVRNNLIYRSIYNSILNIITNL